MKIVPEKRQRIQPGQVFGRRTVLGPEFYVRLSEKRPFKFVVCECSCGAIDAVNGQTLLNGGSLSCGCLSDEVFATRNSWHAQGLDRKRHGDSRPEGNKRLHQIWIGMRRRCRDEKYVGYCGRGISVCDEWESYETFKTWAMEHGYRPGLQIDRENNDGNYEPGNCRWTTPLVQMNNTRWNRWVEAFGERKTVMQWSRDDRCIPTYEGLRARLNQGMSPEAALTKPLRGGEFNGYGRTQRNLRAS